MKHLCTALCATLLLFVVSSCAVLGTRADVDEERPDPEDRRSETAQPSPLPEAATRMQYVSAHSELVLGLDSSGTVWRWGATDADLGGPPWSGAVVTTRQVPAFHGATWVSVAAGPSHAVLVSGQGGLYTWGNNAGNVLGLGSSFSHVRFLVDVNRIAASEHWVRAFAGADVSFAITQDGRVFAWGMPASGALGLGEITIDNPALTLFEFWGPTDRTEELAVPQPEQIDGLTGIVEIALGESFALALTAGGHVYSWGRNDSGMLGLGDREDRYVPNRVELPMSADRVAAGTYSAFAVTETGRLYGWGGNRYGELGSVANGNEETPVPVFPERRWHMVATGAHTGLDGVDRPVVYGISDSGWLYSWASGSSDPLPVPGDTGGWATVTVGRSRIIGVRQNGAVYSWVHGESVPTSRLTFP